MDGWILVYEGFEPEHEALRETLCTLGNGYFATRGAGEECSADEVHYPGTYFAGGYNRLTSTLADHTVINEDLVNFPNWLALSFKPEGGQWFNLFAGEILSYRQELHMHEGALRREIRFRDHDGRETTIKSLRLVHMKNCHLAALQVHITPENWSGPMQIKSGIDGSIINAGVKRYQQLNTKHLEIMDMDEIDGNTIYLKTRTNQSHIEITQAAKTFIAQNGNAIQLTGKTQKNDECIYKLFSLEAKQGETITVEKIVSVFTSKDSAISETTLDACLLLNSIENFHELINSHRQAWQYLWHRCDVKIKPSNHQQLIIRLHIFHLLQSVSLHTIDLDVGVPARGLHGEAYRGHIFWDELFIFPLLTYRLPEVTRSLLLYRYRRLPMARMLAKQAGFKGAIYPWQSGSNGQEETQEIHLNPRTNTWGPDYSRKQFHVNAAIVYNIWKYYQITQDERFLIDFGAEMMLEIAHFWSSLTTYNEISQRYEIHGVMGPDEYHEKYPDTDEPGLKNNTYTNVMVVWVLERALEILKLLQPDRRSELLQELGISSKELERWRDITQKMTIPFMGNGIINQFEGYDKLKEFDWKCYAQKYGNIERLDRLLKAEGDSPNNYKVSKQADVLMLFYLFSPKELRYLFNKLGYEFSDETAQKNIEYYQKRTSHGSTLSKVVFASVLDYIDRDAAWHCFTEALQSDISDTQGETTGEGIHLGAMAGSVDIVMRHFVGVNVSGEHIAFNPRLPKHDNYLEMRLCHHGHWFLLVILDNKFQLTLEKNNEKVVYVYICGEKVTLRPGQTIEVPL